MHLQNEEQQHHQTSKRSFYYEMFVVVNIRDVFRDVLFILIKVPLALPTHFLP